MFSRLFRHQTTWVPQTLTRPNFCGGWDWCVYFPPARLAHFHVDPWTVANIHDKGFMERKHVLRCWFQCFNVCKYSLWFKEDSIDESSFLLSKIAILTDKPGHSYQVYPGRESVEARVSGPLRKEVTWRVTSTQSEFLPAISVELFALLRQNERIHIP